MCVCIYIYCTHKHTTGDIRKYATIIGVVYIGEITLNSYISQGNHIFLRHLKVSRLLCQDHSMTFHLFEDFLGESLSTV